LAREIKLNSKIQFDRKLNQPSVVALRNHATKVARATVN